MRDFLYRASRWLVALAFAAVLIFLIYRFFPWQAFRFDQLDPRLPEIFHYNDSPWIFWGWVVCLLTLATLTAFRLRALLRRDLAARGPAVPVTALARDREDNDTGAPAIAFAPGTETSDPIYLFLSTSVDAVTDLFRAADVASTGEVILTTQPQRAVLINAALSSLLSRGESIDGSSLGLEGLCRGLIARDPEYPWLRGVFLVLPFDELTRADPSILARRIHADLHTIRRVTELDLPTHLLVTRMEKVPGFIKFANLRGPHEARQGRWGISLPYRGDDDSDSAWRSLVDFRFQVRRRTLDLLVRDLLDSDRNARLLGLDRILGSIIGPLATLIAGSFPAAEKDRPFLRTIDMVATGHRPEDQAYLLSSVYLPIMRDQDATRWTLEALKGDQLQRRRAGRLAAGAGATALCVWLYIQFGLGSLSWWGWAILLALVSGWIAVLVIMWRRWPGSPPGRTS
jgi:hypothetical protein